MKVEFIHKSLINPEKWDACISSSHNANPCGNSWFLEHISNDWHGLVLDDYQAVMPLITGKKMGISYIFQPPYFQRTELFINEKPDQHIIDLFYAAIPKKFKLHEFNVALSSSPGTQHKYVTKQLPNLILSLQAAYTDLQKNFGSNTKRNIKKALKQNLTFRSSEDPKKLIAAYKTNRGLDSKDLGNEDYTRLGSLILKSLEKKSGEILEAYTNDEDFAGGIFILKAYKRHILLFMGANEVSKTTGAMFALIDFYLQKSCNTEAIFDFEGSLDSGVARFYSGFGAIEEKYLAIKKDNLNKLFSFAKRLMA